MLPERQKLCINELPEGYRVVGVEGCAFVVRDPSGREMLLEQDGELYGVTMRRSFAAQFGRRARRLGRETASNPYLRPMD
jgi:hypothetical protein